MYIVVAVGLEREAFQVQHHKIIKFHNMEDMADLHPQHKAEEREQE